MMDRNWTARLLATLVAVLSAMLSANPALAEAANQGAARTRVAGAAESVTRFDGVYVGQYQLVDGAYFCGKQFAALLQIRGGRVALAYETSDVSFSGAVDAEGKLSAQSNSFGGRNGARAGSMEASDAAVLKGGIAGDVFQGKAESDHCTYGLQLGKQQIDRKASEAAKQDDDGGATDAANQEAAQTRVAGAAEPVTRFDGAYAGEYQLIDGAYFCAKQFGAILQIRSGRIALAYETSDVSFSGAVDADGKLSAQSNSFGGRNGARAGSMEASDASVLKGDIAGDVFQGKAESDHCTYGLQLRKRSGA
jgi:hypothetical protein